MPDLLITFVFAKLIVIGSDSYDHVTIYALCLTHKASEDMTSG